jgi:tripartite-type tricarboxylate transporter receptor subunit TctC
MRAMIRSLLSALGAALIACAPPFAQAQDYPARSIRVIVPFATGGSTDILIRTVGQRMSESLGQQLFIDNRGGAGGALGAQLAAKARPDGYAIMATTSGVVVPIVR